MAGRINPKPHPKGLIVAKIAVISTRYFSRNHVPLIFAGEFIIKGFPIPEINPPSKTSQNPPSFKKILTNDPQNVNEIPTIIAIYG